MRICTSVFAQSLCVPSSLCAFWMGSLTGSLMLSIAYGVNIESESDRFFAASEDAMAAVDIAMLPGAFLVDVLPIRTNSSRKGDSRTILQCQLPQSNTSRNGFLGPVSRRLQGRPRRTLMIPSPLRSNMLKNLLRFASFPYRFSPGIETNYRRAPFPLRRLWERVWRNYRNFLSRGLMKEWFGP